MWSQEKGYSDLMRELWGSPERWNSRKTYTDVAAKLGVDEETVRNRIKRLRESGFLLGWRIVPNPALFERSSAMMLLEFKSDMQKEAAVGELKRKDGVVIIASVYGSGFLVTYCDDPAGTASKGILEVEGVKGAKPIGGMRLPPTTFDMTPTDWQILWCMLRNAEEDIGSVARRVRVSTRTVKRRLNGMMDSAAISVMPVVDQSRMGGVSYTVLVEAEEGKTNDVGEAVASKIPNLVFRATYQKNGLIFGYSAPNVAEGKSLLVWVSGLAGVRSARMHVVDEVIYAFDWLEGEAKKRSVANRAPAG